METKNLKLSTRCSHGLDNLAKRIMKACTIPCRLVNKYKNEKVDKLSDRKYFPIFKRI
jgi:hypothetical protein